MLAPEECRFLHPLERGKPEKEENRERKDTAFPTFSYRT